MGYVFPLVLLCFVCFVPLLLLPHPCIFLSSLHCYHGAETACSHRAPDTFIQIAGLVIEGLRVRVPAGAAGGFKSPELTFCAEYHSVSFPTRVTAVAGKRTWSFCQKCRWKVAPYTLDYTPLTQRSRSGPTMLTRHSVGSISWERAHPQLVREHSATVVSAR